MNKKLISVFCLILMAFGLSACGTTIVRGSGNIITENRDVSHFNSMAFSVPGDLIITQGNEESLKIEAEDNLVPYIITEVRGNTLHIYADPRKLAFLNPRKPMRFEVTLKELKSLDLSGSGSISSKEIKTDTLDANISGSGRMDFENLTANTLNIDLSGSGVVALKGNVETESLDVSGSGDCDLSGLTSKSASINISGSGKTSVNATDNLDLNISGSGNLTYTGNPHITQSISGSGKIISK
ncbi:head GIN domain-containing protein [Leptolinea tardivitalis]|uniref:Putative auto-transporter adhesin head GIN domain-containing protein n=1 Tax=Leptolinea tardivitalis TaxID=229920 RepID=A0A0P6WLA5_9CHLR|nr:head GIN domain-containing protein [Leptolinea tardivitalis]KPL70573.1 hypothetical protein ADM99_15790 [Leptolinea tardivitalis]GAP22182.1 hypothetical protein LTAR_02406 [Leptolinea tardivitalis]